MKQAAIRGETRARVPTEEKRRRDGAEHSRIFFALFRSNYPSPLSRTNYRSDFYRYERHNASFRTFCIRRDRIRVCPCLRSSSSFLRFLLHNRGHRVHLKNETSGLRIFASAYTCRLFVPTLTSVYAEGSI